MGLTQHERIQQRLRQREALKQTEPQATLTVEVGAMVKPGDVARWSDGTETPVPPLFHGQKVKKPGIIFRVP